MLSSPRKSQQHLPHLLLLGPARAVHPIPAVLFVLPLAALKRQPIANIFTDCEAYIHGSMATDKLNKIKRYSSPMMVLLRIILRGSSESVVFKCSDPVLFLFFVFLVCLLFVCVLVQAILSSVSTSRPLMSSLKAPGTRSYKNTRMLWTTW